MRKSSKLILMAGAIAALAVPSAASAAAPTVFDGSKDYSGFTPVENNVIVPAGKTAFFWGTIKGNVTVNGRLLMSGGEVTGSVTVNQGGSFQAFNYGVTIGKNLTITNPTNAESPIFGNQGFYGNQDGSSNLVKGNVTYTMDPSLYPTSTWPSLDFVGGTTVQGNLTYNVRGLPERPLNEQGLTVLGNKTIS